MIIKEIRIICLVVLIAKAEYFALVKTSSVNSSQPELSAVVKNNSSIFLGKVDVKKRLIFTCTICHTQNDKLISKLAYEKGIIIVRCDGCKKLHLVADNLDWFKNPQGKNIEEILATKGEKVQKSDTVFEFGNKTES